MVLSNYRKYLDVYIFTSLLCQCYRQNVRYTHFIHFGHPWQILKAYFSKSLEFGVRHDTEVKKTATFYVQKIQER